MRKRDVINPGDCVKTHDGRIARVRAMSRGGYRVRVRRMSGKTSQFLVFTGGELERVPCPKGWMSPEGYNRYLRATLEKMRERLPLKKKSSSGSFIQIKQKGTERQWLPGKRREVP